MSKPYRLVVFDWEGTLGDALGPMIHAVATEARLLNLGELDCCLARQYIALGLPRAVKKWFPQASLTQQEQLLEAINRSIPTRANEICLFPGAKVLLNQIKQAGMALGIATNKGQNALLHALQACDLEGVFDVTRSAGQCQPKPSPMMLEEIMDACGVDASTTLMVGDSVNDMEMASQVGVDAVGIDFDHQQSTHQLLSAGACYVFDNYDQLKTYLQLRDLT